MGGPAEQPHQGLAGRLGAYVPGRHVDTGRGHGGETLRPGQPEGALEFFFQGEGRNRLARDEFAQVVEQGHDRRERKRGIAEDVRTAGHAFFRFEIDEHQRGFGDRPGAGVERTGHRRQDCAGAQPSHGQRIGGHGFSL